MPARHQRRVEWRDIEGLKPYPRNARLHPKKQLQKIARSIKRFGFVAPILIDATGRIIAGHARVEATKLAGINRIPCVVLEGLSEPEKAAYTIADNRLAEEANWDRPTLALEFKDLLEAEFDLVLLTGFETPEIDLLLGEPPVESDNADTIPSLAPGAPITMPGALWKLGDHLLFCGDARRPEDYRQLLGDAKVELVITDPPYNLPIHGHVSGRGRTRHREFAVASGEMSSPEFIGFLESVCGLIARYSRNGTIVYISMDWRHGFEILTAGRRAFSELKNICVWHKTHPGMGTFYRSAHEFVFVWKNGRCPHINNFELGQHGRYRTNVWTYSAAELAGPTRSEGLKLHPTIKPVGLYQDAMLDCSHRGGLVLDPFCGSGTVLIAAERARRKARAMEIDPHYVDLAVRRWQSYTGELAINTRTGKPFGDSDGRAKRRTPR